MSSTQVEKDFIKRIGRCEVEGCKASLSKLTLDHIIPLSKGGQNTISNWQVLCKPHNMEKADRIMNIKELHGQAVERGMGNAYEGTIKFDFTSIGTFSIRYEKKGKQILINLRQDQAKELKAFINKVIK